MTQPSHQIEEHVPEVRPAVISLRTVGAWRADHVCEDPFVDIEVLEREGYGIWVKGSSRSESQRTWGQKEEKQAVCVCVGAREQ